MENVAKSAGFATAAFGPLALSVWDSIPTPSQARSAATLLATLAKTEKNILVMAVLGANVPPPDGEVREILSQQLAKIDDRVRAVANVIEGQGFRAATVRAVLTGMSLVLRTKRPEKVCNSVEEAGLFVASHSDRRLTMTDVTRAVADLRDLTR